jgi:hypothetical protein
MTIETIRTPSGFKNLDTGATGPLSATLLPTSVSGSAPSTVLGVTVGNGATQDFQVAFYIANIDQDPTLTFQLQLGGPPIATVQGVSVFGSGLLPNGLFEIFYTVTIRREQVATDVGFIIPILTLNGVSGTTAPVTVDLQ